jgi:hypothetical protein
LWAEGTWSRTLDGGALGPMKRSHISHWSSTPGSPPDSPSAPRANPHTLPHLPSVSHTQAAVQRAGCSHWIKRPRAPDAEGHWTIGRRTRPRHPHNLTCAIPRRRSRDWRGKGGEGIGEGILSPHLVPQHPTTTSPRYGTATSLGRVCGEQVTASPPAGVCKRCVAALLPRLALICELKRGWGG